MQFDAAHFVKLAGKVLCESGNITQRPSYGAMAIAAQELLEYKEQVLPTLKTPHALLFVAATASSAVKYGLFMRTVWHEILINLPDEQTIELLKILPLSEVQGTLLPMLYEQGNKGALACYVAALLHLKLVADSVSYFLSARSWSLTSLVNLACLVDPNDALKISSNLEKLSAQSSFEGSKEVFSEFRYILFNSNTIKPLVPDLDPEEISFNLKELKAKKQSDSAASANSTAKATSKPTLSANNAVHNRPPAQSKSQTQAQPQAQSLAQPQPQAQTQNQSQAQSLTQSLPQAQTQRQSRASAGKAPKTGLSTHASGTKAPAGDSVKNLKQKKLIKQFDDLFKPSNSVLTGLMPIIKPYLPIAAGVILAAAAALMIFDTYRSHRAIEGAGAAHKTAQTADTAPKFYINAENNKKITKEFLKADKSFRMGQLYLLRNQYENALKMYKNALEIDKTHTTALIQSGLCHLQLKNYQEAESCLKAALKAAPKERAINLYLARAYVGSKNIKAANKHYKAEYNTHKDISAGMEYAGFLAKYVSKNEAAEVVGNLQTLYPDKALVLLSGSEAEGGS